MLPAKLVTVLTARWLRKLLLAGTAAITIIAPAFLSADRGQARLNAGLSPVSKPETPAMPEPDPFSNERPAKGKFLVANRNLNDPRFEETVVLLFDYSSEGAAGLIINRPTEVPLAELFPDLPGLKDRSDVVYYGGPVEGHRMLMLIRSGKRPEESSRVFADVFVSASMNTLERLIGTHETGKRLRLYAGYAGWLPRQLDREVSRGDWIIMNADAGSIFEKKPSEVWRELFRRGSAIQVLYQPGYRTVANRAVLSSRTD